MEIEDRYSLNMYIRAPRLIFRKLIIPLIDQRLVKLTILGVGFAIFVLIRFY